MSQQFHQAVQAILAMGYYRNEAARSGLSDPGHERAVALELDRAGFTAEIKGHYPALTRSLLKKWARTGQVGPIGSALQAMPEGTYIVQPGGSQAFPDILVRDFGGRFVAVECKSGKSGTCPMWNDRLPSRDAVYILSSGRHDATTVFLGRDIITPKEIQIQEDLLRDLLAVMAQYRARAQAADRYKRGWHFKFRPQNFQGGGQHLSDYFLHQDRGRCEKNVLDFSGL